MNHFDQAFSEHLQTQLWLEFTDEQVLNHFPSAWQRRILRTLHLQSLIQTRLLKGVRQQFVNAKLASCKVEIFSPGEAIVERGAILSDLFLFMGAIAEVISSEYVAATTSAVTSGTSKIAPGLLTLGCS